MNNMDAYIFQIIYVYIISINKFINYTNTTALEA